MTKLTLRLYNQLTLAKDQHEFRTRQAARFLSSNFTVIAVSLFSIDCLNICIVCANRTLWLTQACLFPTVSHLLLDLEASLWPFSPKERASRPCLPNLSFSLTRSYIPPPAHPSGRLSVNAAARAKRCGVVRMLL